MYMHVYYRNFNQMLYISLSSYFNCESMRAILKFVQFWMSDYAKTCGVNNRGAYDNIKSSKEWFHV